MVIGGHGVVTPFLFWNTVDKMSGELGYNNAGFFFYIFDKTRGQK